MQRNSQLFTDFMSQTLSSKDTFEIAGKCSGQGTSLDVGKFFYSHI